MSAHWHADADCAVCDHEQRIADLERRLDRLTRGIHLALASVQPGLDWIDAETRQTTTTESEG